MSAATAPAAVPSRAGHTGVVGALIAATAATMAMVALGGAYLAFRYGNGVSFARDSGMKYNNYSAVIIVFTLILASGAAGWGVMAARLENRRSAATGFGLAALFDLAALNLLYSIGYQLGFSVDSSPHATMVYALFVAGGIAIGVGTLCSLAGLALSLGGHANASTKYQALAVSVGQHFAGLAWLVPFAAIFLKK